MNLQGLNDLGVLGAFIIGAAVGIFFTLGYYAARWATLVSATKYAKARNRGKNLHIEELAGKLHEARQDNVHLMSRAKISFESGRASGLIDGRNEGYEAAAESYEAEIKELQARYDRAQHGNVIDLTDRIMHERANEQRSRANHPAIKGGGR